MSKVFKSKKFIFFITFCLLSSAVLLLFNLSQFERYQKNRRNTERKEEIEIILQGIENYITNTKNLPTSSNPAPKSFLPELIFNNPTNPSGGVSVQSLENMQGYFDLNIKDPSGNPYSIGTFEDQVIVYTSHLEKADNSSELYFDTLKLDTKLEKVE